MKMFEKVLAILLLMALALSPVTGLGEEDEEESKTAFETLRDLMETQFSPDIPVREGEDFANIVIDDDIIAKRVAENPKKNKASSYNKTPSGILCQILFENRQKARKDVTDKSGTPVQEFKIINSAINGDYEYEAVRYNHLSLEQMLYYAYVVSSNYSAVQDKLPAGETFSIVVKYGDSILLINDVKQAEEFSRHVADAVAKLAEGGTAAE